MVTAGSFKVRIADWDQDREALQAVRHVVFVVEQGVPEELEWDAADPESRHVVAESGGLAIGTGRLLADGHIGRLAVLEPWRGRGVGKALFELLVQMAEMQGHRRIALNAQVRAQAFYLRFGFVAQGEPFMEAGIEHIAMVRALNR